MLLRQRAPEFSIGTQSPGYRCRRQWLILVVAAFVVFQLAAILASQDAFAQCATSGTDPVTLTCAANATTTATTNTTSPNAATSDRTQQFNADMIGQINPGVTVSGVGLDLITTKIGGGITFTNAGTVSTTTAPSVLQLDGNGGAISYSGAGTISSTTTAANGLVLNNIGAGGIAVLMTGGQIGASGARVSSGVVATTSTGVIDITSTSIFAVSNGINAQMTGGGNGGVTIHAGDITTVGGTGIISNIVGGTGNTAITLGGTITATFAAGGVSASSSSTGSMSVGGGGSITSNNGGAGISVTNSATSTSGDITITPSGNINSTPFNAIIAQVTNAANNANIVVTPTGTVSGGGFGGTGAITATTAGGGNVTVTTSNNVTAVTGAAIKTTTAGGTNTVNITGGTNTASGGNGPNVGATSGSGNIAVNVNNAALLGGGGIAGGGIAATSGSGNIVVDLITSVLGTNAAKVGTGVAATTTSGAIDITSTSTSINSISNGINAQMTGGGNGGVTIHAGDITTVGGTGIISNIVGGTGNTAITLGGTITATFAAGGVSASSSSTGSMSVGGGGSITSNNGGAGISVTNSATSTSGDITITPSGNINSTPFNAIIAQVTNAANNANIVVTPTGTVSGGGFGGTGAITATTAGGGNVTVTTSNNVTAVTGAAIKTTTAGGTNTVNITGGTVQATGGADAIDVTATSGKNVVNNSAAIVGTLAGINFLGGTASALNNFGTITGPTGVAATVGAVTVFNAGTITGTGGTAVQFAGSGNTLTIAPTSVITGNAVGTGADAFQLGGTGIGSFNSALIGPAAQYRGFGNYNKVGASTWTLTGTNALVLPWTVQQGTLNVAGSLANSPFTVQAGTLSVTGTIGSATVNGGQFSVLSGGLAGPVTLNNGTGTINGTIGVATVNGGVLSLLAGGVVGPATVNGGVLAGDGTVGNTQINASGTFAPGIPGSPGTAMSVAGNLAFQSGAFYLTQLNATTASLANVTGTASLAGTVLVSLTPGAISTTKQYDILHAAGGRNGTFAGAQVLSPNFSASLSYNNTDVFLNLAASLGLGGKLNVNQTNVANAINNVFNGAGTLPPGFLGLFGLSGSSLGNALTQISGETATGAQQTTFDAMNQFLGLLTDPFISGRGDPVSAGGNPTAYAEQTLAYASSKRTNAFAMFTKAPPVPTFEQRWSVWAAGYGGSQRTDGNAALGSNDTRSRVYGTAVGLDYRLSPNTLAGIALAGGGTNFSVNTLGYGRSDLFQAGAFIRHNVGPAYFTGALAYGWQDISTDRTVAVAALDHLRARFNANAWSGRIEGGYRFATNGLGITPYAAGQFTTFDLPAYAEQAIVGSNQFALAYGAKSVTDARSELGVRTDKSFAMPNGIFTLRGRAAWAHDYDPNRSIGATFQTLPGASFVVNGAALASDSALITASAEMKWLNGWSAAATFEGEFSNVTSSYAGKGVLRYAW